MGKAPDSISPSATTNERFPAPGGREIIIPHEPGAGPVTAIRNLVLQSSLKELEMGGYFERYKTLIDPAVLHELTSNVGPAWIAADLALQHYKACDDLGLTTEEFLALGKRVGDRIQDATIVSPAKKARDASFDVWGTMRQFHRIWARIYVGGSVQVVKGGPKKLLLEQLGFPFNRYNYYRLATVATVRATYTSVGIRITQVKVASYDPKRNEVVIQAEWL